MFRFPPRVVSILCTIQVFVIMSCYMMTKTFHKAIENFGIPYYYSTPRPAKFVLFTGPWLLLVPLSWGVSAMLYANVDGGIPEISERHTRIGYCLLIILGILCVSGAVFQFAATFAPPVTIHSI